MILTAMSLVQAFMILDPAWLIYAANVAAASIAIGCLALLAERLVRRGTLPLRHLLLVSGLIALLAAPVLVAIVVATGLAPIQITAAAHDSAPQKPPQAAAASMSEAMVPQAMPAAPLEREQPVQTIRPTLRRSQQRVGPASVATGLTVTPPTEPMLISRVLWISASVLLTVWLAGCLNQFVRLIRGVLSVQRLLRNVQPVDDPRIARIAGEAARRLGLRRLPSICQTPEIEAPLSVGVLQSRIVLPAGQVVEWPDQAWRALLLHELAHVQRGDLQMGLAQRIATALFWWNPLVLRLSRQISALREQICDDLVTQYGSRDDGYAAIIVELASRVVGRTASSPALGATDGSPSELTQRIYRLLEPERVLTTSLSVGQKRIALAFSLILLALIAGTTTTWAVAEEPPASSPATQAPPNQSSPNQAQAVQPLDDAAKKALTAVTDVQKNDLKKIVRIVDLEGKPLAGATVTPWAFRSSQGHSLWIAGNMTREAAPTVTTDADGRATIPFPRYGNPIEKVPMDALTCVVKHPDFATTRYNDVNVRPDFLPDEAEIKLAPGARVTITPKADGIQLDHKRLFAMWSSPTDSFAAPVTDECQIELPRLPAGEELFRVVYLPQDGPALFSSVVREKLTDGQHLQLKAELRPGVTVRGKLDERVSRPVENGSLTAQSIDATNNARNTLDWRMTAVIEPDGTFQIDDVPVDSQLQVIALCDEFMATSGEAPEFVPQDQRRVSKGFSAPQVFPVGNADSEITLAMTPTVECDVTVIDQAGKPIEGAKVYFGPIVKWWNGGSQIYAHPRYSMKEILTDRNFSAAIGKRDLQPSPFQAITDEHGIARVKNLPPRSNDFSVSAEGFEMPIEGNSRSQRVDMHAGEPLQLTVALQPTSPNRLGDLPQALRDACQIIGTSGVLIKPLPPVNDRQ